MRAQCGPASRLALTLQHSKRPPTGRATMHRNSSRLVQASQGVLVGRLSEALPPAAARGAFSSSRRERAPGGCQLTQTGASRLQESSGTSCSGLAAKIEKPDFYLILGRIFAARDYELISASRGVTSRTVRPHGPPAAALAAKRARNAGASPGNLQQSKPRGQPPARARRPGRQRSRRRRGAAPSRARAGQSARRAARRAASAGPEIAPRPEPRPERLARVPRRRRAQAGRRAWPASSSRWRSAPRPSRRTRAQQQGLAIGVPLKAGEPLFDRVHIALLRFHYESLVILPGLHFVSLSRGRGGPTG
jgi:hypothetical protein